ncbi:amino acid permease [Coxiella burnetii]|nr:amino acid permease family protein [Coxiella burnetii RSA 331]AML49244.1 amino acid permease [Coxiella burnetii]AML55178.1 amino acid permease [Coxiella burnetii]ATN69158.1 amino acid permease [Coxiella burnetii]ATN71074.1 amino acid permease [Coxiella burnetii]
MHSRFQKGKIPNSVLKRDLGLIGATMMGLGSIVGTGVFVSIGVAAGVTGPSVVLAIVLAALVATCNALSSAQLAASHPVSGGTHEYGYRYLHPALGFTAGWMFLCAKIASAATAALGFAGYLLHLLGITSISMIPIAVSIAILLTLLVLSGLKKSNLANLIIVSIILISLITFVLSGLPHLFSMGLPHFKPFFPTAAPSGLRNFLYATALMFVAYTGYARIATLGEEVKNPKPFIPQAIILTLIISAVLYIAVAVVAISIVGADHLSQAAQNRATPLETAARALNRRGLDIILAFGACTAMLGVLLNLMLGLSRMALAMGRKRDLPSMFGTLSKKQRTPSAAILGVGLAIIGLSLIGNVEITWAFSAFTVLIYYFITNLSALQLPKADRLYPRIFPVGGLIACLFLAFWVPLMIWSIGIGLIAVGLAWKYFMARLWI